MVLDLTGCVISVVGEEHHDADGAELPFDANDLMQISERLGGLPGILHLSSTDKPIEVWQDDQLIAVGTKITKSDEDYLMRSVYAAKAYDLRFDYMSQLDYLHYISTGEHPDYLEDLSEIRKHRGLRFLSTIGFVWPDVDTTPSYSRSASTPRSTGTTTKRLQTESWLKSKYGYHVGGVTPLRHRHTSLEQAVKGEGLYPVVIFIANFLIGLNKRRRKPSWDAIDKWEADLDWLKRTYYETSHHSFVWPDY